MQTLRTIIIDDEELARQLIARYCENHTDIEVIGQCADGFEAVKAINQLKPDLVFLDVQMPKLDGFELLEILDHRPQVIFTTAYNEYAIRAFEQNAVDYLLKPFARERFDKALDKVRTLRHQHQKPDFAATSLIGQPLAEYINRVVVKNGTKIKIIPTDHILYFEAQDDYVMVYTHEAHFLKQQTMKHFESVLDPRVFVRTHRSYIVRIEAIQQIEPYEKDSHIIKLSTGARLPVSRSGYQLLKSVLSF